MNHLPRCDQPATSNAPLSAPAKAEAQPMPDAGVLRLRAVHRAVADLRRGTPVVLIGPNNLVLIPAETAGSRGLGELAALAKSPPSCCWPPRAPRPCYHRPHCRSPAARLM